MSESIKYTQTTEIVSEDIIKGKDCYIMENLQEHQLPYEGEIYAEMWIDKATFLPICQKTWDRRGATATVTPYVYYNYEFPEEPFYPLKVGKECKVIVTVNKL